MNTDSRLSTLDLTPVVIVYRAHGTGITTRLYKNSNARFSSMKFHFCLPLLLSIVVAALLGTTSSSAQLLQGGLVFGADGSDTGIRVGVYYPIVLNVDAGGDFTLFFPGNGVDIYEFNANGRYELPVDSDLRVFAVGGLNFTDVSVESSSNSSKGNKSHTGINVGGMIQKGTGPLGLYMDAKFILGGIEQFEVGAGITFDL